MIKKFLVVLITITLALVSMKVSALESINVEIFDIDKETVVKKVESTPAIQKEVEIYLNGITGIYGKFNPVPKQGYMIKIPLQEPAMVQNPWINSFVEEVILIFPKDEEPYLLVFNNEDRTLFFNFEGDTETLLKILNYERKTNPISQNIETKI